MRGRSNCRPTPTPPSPLTNTLSRRCAATKATGAAGPSTGTSRSGATLTACAASASPTRRCGSPATIALAHSSTDLIARSQHFHDVTLIEDVRALYEKIRASLATEQFVLDAHEEYEDSQGNVLDRRTYEDLARQGLL